MVNSVLDLQFLEDLECNNNLLDITSWRTRKLSVAKFQEVLKKKTLVKKNSKNKKWENHTVQVL